MINMMSYHSSWKTMVIDQQLWTVMLSPGQPLGGYWWWLLWWSFSISVASQWWLIILSIASNGWECDWHLKKSEYLNLLLTYCEQFLSNTEESKSFISSIRILGLARVTKFFYISMARPGWKAWVEMWVIEWLKTFAMRNVGVEWAAIGVHVWSLQ